MIEKLQTLIKLAIVCLVVYLVYGMYQPDADRLIGELRASLTGGRTETVSSSEETEGKGETERSLILPESYDLRIEGRAPSVKNQGQLGTCWAIAATSALESALLPGETMVFSADHMSIQNGYAKSQNDGGAYTMAMAYLASWKGPVLESQDPYGDGYSPEGLSAVKHVQEMRMLHNASLQEIKEAVMRYGAVQSSLYVDIQDVSSSAYYNGSQASYCYKGEEEANHDILIIGWDDNYQPQNFLTTVTSPGAFICQNSWGTGFGENGVFYVSYEDAQLGAYCTVYTGIEETDNFDHIYQSDLLGWVGQLGYDTDTCYFANVYEAGGNETLEAVGFYATGRNTEYEIYIAEDFYSTLSLVSWMPDATGSFEDAGFYTVRLPKPVSLGQGQRYAVVVKIRTPGERYPVAMEYQADANSAAADISDGEGYISLGGYRWTNTEDSYQCNVCLKAYTKNR